jgi:hypothetical protein
MVIVWPKTSGRASQARHEIGCGLTRKTFFDLCIPLFRVLYERPVILQNTCTARFPTSRIVTVTIVE